MADSCSVCGFKSSELKSGGGISARGRRCTLRVTRQEDLRRDVIKADTATVAVPELEFEARGLFQLGFVGRSFRLKSCPWERAVCLCLFRPNLWGEEVLLGPP